MKLSGLGPCHTNFTRRYPSSIGIVHLPSESKQKEKRGNGEVRGDRRRNEKGGSAAKFKKKFKSILIDDLVHSVMFMRYNPEKTEFLDH